MKKLNTRRVHCFIALMILSLAFAPLMNAQVLQLNVPDNVKRIVINDYYTDYQFYDGMLAVQNRETGKWGFINDKGDLVHDFVWSSAETIRTLHFGGNACSVTRDINGKKVFYVIDNTGKSYRIPGEVISISDYCSGYARAKKRVGGVSKIVFLNNKGQEVFQNLSYSAMVMEQVNKPYPFSEGLARYYNQGKFGYINSSGRIAIPVRYDDARDFSEGLAAVKVSTTSGARWGFIDMTGKWVIPAKFSNEPYPFIEGFSSVEKANGNCVAIDRTGEVVSVEFRDIRQFHKGYALVHLLGKQNASLIDKNFQIVKNEIEEARLAARERFRWFLDYQNDCCVVDGGMFRTTLLTYKGEEPFHLSSYNYYKLDSRYNQIMHCKTEGNNTRYDGFIDYNGNFLFIFVEDEF